MLLKMRTQVQMKKSSNKQFQINKVSHQAKKKKE